MQTDAHHVDRDAISRPALSEALKVLGVVDVSLVSLQARYGEARQALDTFVAVIDRLHDAGDWTHLWTGLPVHGEDADRLAAVEGELAGQLGDDALAAAHGRGRAMSDHDAIAFARAAIERAKAG